MRIAYIVNQFPALSETFILDNITGLIDRGHEVDIYSNLVGNLSKIHPEVESYKLLERTFYPEMPKNYGARGTTALRFMLSDGFEDKRVWLRSLNVLQYGRKAASLRLLYTVSRFMDKQPYDIVHCQLGFLGLEGMLLRNLGAFQGKLVTTFRGSDFMIYLKMFGKHYFDELFQQCDLILTVCEHMKRQKVQLGCDENKIIVHRDGIDFERFVFKPRQIDEDKRVRLITIARLEENKGIEYSIRAVAKLVNVYPNIEYHIIGDGPLMGELQQAIEEVGAIDRIKLLGWKQRPEVIEELNESHILIAPSVLGKNGTQEGIPSVIKEAMAMGLPVVATRHSGIPELVEEGVSGFLVPERDVEALVEKLSFAIANSERWPDMGRAGRAFLEQHYDIHQLNDRLVEIYQELLASSRTPAKI